MPAPACLTTSVPTESTATGVSRDSEPRVQTDGRQLEGNVENESVLGTPPFGDGPHPGPLGQKLVWALGLGLLCALLAALVFGFTSGERLRTPLAREDNFYYASLVKTIDERGWYRPTPVLGAPHGQDLLDLPLGDNHLHLLALKAMTFVWSDPITVLNLYVILAFGLIASVTYLCLRSVGVEHWPAVVAAILFAFLPYHFGRAPFHPFLQSYFEVPLVLPLTKWVLGGRLVRRPGLERLLVIGLALIVASTGVYYAAMLAILLVAAAGVDLLRTRRPASLVRAAGAVGVIGVVLVANFAPNILYQWREGTNPELAQRSAWEAEALGLRPSLLLLPSPHHRIGRLAEIGLRARDVPSPGEGPIALGAVGASGLALCLAFALVSMVRTGLRDLAAGYLGVLTVVALLVGTKGGLSYAAALLGGEQLRTWSRIAIFIGLLSLTFLALRVPVFRTRFGPRVTAGVLAAVLLVGLVDQIPGDPTPGRTGYATEVAADRSFTREMERALPPGAMVFNLPVTRFPEEPPPGIASGYDDLRFHILGTGKLRYSYGGLRGRKDQWRERWAGLGHTETVLAAAAGGFSALVVDRYGLDPNTKKTEDELNRLIGLPVSDNSAWRRYAWYDLRPLRQRLEEAIGGRTSDVQRAVVNPPFLRWSGGGQAYRRVFPVGRDLQALATAEVSSPVPRPARLDGVLRVPEGGEVLVRFEDQVIARVPAGEHRLEVPLTLTREKSLLQFELLDPATGRRMDGRVVVATGLHVVDPAADVLLDLARSWTRR
jgi:hypothetical protein